MTQTGEATHLINEASLTQPVTSATESYWFAIQTKARHEKRVAAELREKGVVAFLPLSIEVHQWSDRKRRVELPMFSTYVFVRLGAAEFSYQGIGDKQRLSFCWGTGHRQHHPR